MREPNHLHVHPTLVSGVFDLLRLIFEKGRHAELAVPAMLKAHPKWGSRDRHFVAEATYDIVRWWRFLWHLVDSEPDFSDDGLRKLLSAYLVYYKQVDTTAGYQLELPDAAALAARKDTAAPAIALSLPDWLYEFGSKEVGENWMQEMEASNQKAPVFIRVNSFRSSAVIVVQELQKAGFAVHPYPGSPDTFSVTGKGSLVSVPCFNEGAFEIQDAGSQQVVDFMQVEPGMRIIDACAGAGGKTLQLHTLSRDRGRIVAIDTDPAKLAELRVRARRCRASNIDTVVLTSADDIRIRLSTADRLLLDVPCSGSGVFKRNPDSRWKLTAEGIQQLLYRQALLLTQYSAMLKPYGKMVYATCSIFPSENQRQIDQFLAANPEYALEEEKQLYPSGGTDGFYMARIVRNW
jgi:16S rRNA (cytosine967-C5)-methyltransferase